MSLTLDAAGNTLTDASDRGFTYNNAGDLATVSQNSVLKATYTYDAFHRRSQKTLPGGTTILYHYSPQGELLAETNAQGQVLQAYVLADGQPLAKIDSDQDDDGAPDSVDNCINVANSNQRDTDGDGYGNLCDADLNNDGSTNTLDLNLYKAAHRSSVGDPHYNPNADFNGDGNINTLDLNIYKGLHRKPPGPSGLKGQAGPPTVVYLHADHLGTPRAGTNPGGAVVWRWEGAAFGDTAPTGTATVNLRYAGQYYDQETGLYYWGARYYDPKIGRGIQPDRMSVAEHVARWQANMGVPGQPPLELNPYAAVANNPLKWTDPSGQVIGSGIAKILGRILGRTSEETAYGGRVLDTAIGAAVGDVPNCIGGTNISTPRDLLRGIGGASSVSLSISTTYGLYGAGATVGSASAAAFFPGLLALYGGTEVGSIFNSVYEQGRGNSLGSDIYDLINHGQLFDYPSPSKCGCQK